MCRNLGRKFGFEFGKEATLQKLSAIVFALFLMTAAGLAQSAGNVFFGYSYNRASTGVGDTENLNGWEASFEGRVLPHVGMVADFSAQYGTASVPSPFGNFNASTWVQSYLFGPRVSASIGKFRPFAHALIGGAHLHQSQSTSGFVYGESDFADALGGGIDYHLVPMVSLRVQGDDLQTRFNGGLQNDARVSTGVVLRF